MNVSFKLAGILWFAGFFSSPSVAQDKNETIDSWAFDAIHIPVSKTTTNPGDPVVVAVVDDAFRLSHQGIKDFIYKNPKEVSGNQLDDDGNGYTDDIVGWDISDNDNDVSVPEGRDNNFFHGTYIASIITRVASLHYGKAASNKIKIMPVKVLSDQANNTYLKDGYKGIRYAMENGADIICLAWSGGNPGVEELKIIHEAHQKGILIVSSAGNFNEKKIPYPALMPEVLAVAGININLQKAKISNYGMDVDISAPAEFVKGAHPKKDNAYIHDNGTSASTALVVGCAAVIMSKNKVLKNVDIKEALLNSATPFDSPFSIYGGNMGSGMVNLEQALDYISNASHRSNYYSSLRPKGSIVVDAGNAFRDWEIHPEGGYVGFFLEPDISGIKKPKRNSFSILVNDSVWNEYNLSKTPHQIFVPSSTLKIRMQNHPLKGRDLFKINYHGKTIDSTKLYCNGLHYLNLEKGSLDDGSGVNNYTNNCSCRWIITVPAGKRIKFIFDQLDTQPNVDFVYLVDGQTAVPENIIAKFSGPSLPPVVTSLTNEVLVWFVTDSSETGKGWKLHYKTVE